MQSLSFFSFLETTGTQVFPCKTQPPQRNTSFHMCIVADLVAIAGFCGALQVSQRRECHKVSTPFPHQCTCTNSANSARVCTHNDMLPVRASPVFRHAQVHEFVSCLSFPFSPVSLPSSLFALAIQHRLMIPYRFPSENGARCNLLSFAQRESFHIRVQRSTTDFRSTQCSKM